MRTVKVLGADGDPDEQAMVDQAVFSSFETGLGGCGEGGPTVTASSKA